MPLEEPSFDAVEQMVNAENPWPGLSAFTEESARFFHGRDEETADLFQLVRRKVLTVFLGQSGLGKTSLLHAGIFPMLREEDFLPVYIRLNYSDAAPDLLAQIRESLRQACAHARVDGPVAVAGETLWEYFHREENDFWSEKNRFVRPVLIFDQFEEIFTLGADGREQPQRISRLLTELADLIENRRPADLRPRGDASSETLFDSYKANYKVILSLREDFLASLEGLRSRVPSIAHNRFRLQKMDGRQALEVVLRGGGGLVDPDVAEKIVEFVASRNGAADNLAGLEVEPTLLSVFCRELNNKRRRKGEPKITADLLVGSREEILSEFYTRCLHGLDARVQHFIEEKLLTSSGYRNNIALEDALTLPGIDREGVMTLVNRRLFRIEHTSRMPRVELTHDVLTEVIKRSRDARRAKEAAAEMERRQKEIAGQLRQKEEELRLTKRRNVILLAACVAVIIFGVLSFWQYLVAREERKKTEQSGQRADDLIGFMLHDLRDKVEPTGHLKTLDATAQAVLNYQKKLPRDENNFLRQSQNADALDFQGDVLMDEGNFDDAQKSYESALGIMNNITAHEPDNENFNRILLNTYYDIGHFDFAQDTPSRQEMTLKELDQGLQVARRMPLDAKDEDRDRVLAHIYELSGNVHEEKGEHKQAFDDYNQAQAVITRNLQGSPNEALWQFEQGRNDRLMGHVQYFQPDYTGALDSFAQSVNLLDKLSDDERARYESSLAYQGKGDILHSQNQQAEAMDSYQTSSKILESLTELDRDNKEWLHALWEVYNSMGDAWLFQKDFTNAMASYQLGLHYATLLNQATNPESRKWQSQNKEWRSALAFALRGVGKADIALKNYDDAIKMYGQSMEIFKDLSAQTPNDPQDLEDIANAASALGDIYYAQHKYDEAAQQFRLCIAQRTRALELDDGNAMHHNELAWELCTCPVDQLRNGPLALKEAQLAIKNMKGSDYRIIDTLAAAYAETGQFKDAITNEKAALQLAGASGNLRTEGMQLRLKWYEADKPYHRASPLEAFF